MAGSQKIFLRIVGLVGDREDADKQPDRLLVSGRGRLVPTITLGTADVRRGPDDLHEITLVEPVAFNIVNGMLTYNGDPYVWLPVPTGQWVWRIEFEEVVVDGRLRELDGYSFPLTPATPAQMNDPAYPGVNIAQYSLGTWAPGTVNLTAEAIGQITIMLNQASSSAAGASDSAAGASDSAEAAAGSASAAEADRVAVAGDRAVVEGLASQVGSDAGQVAADRLAVAGDRGLVESARSDTLAARDAAEGYASVAEQWATSFDVTATSSTLAPGSQATVTVTGDGPAYHLEVGVPRGDEGPKGDPGEVSQAALDSALAGKADLVDGQVPESQLPEIGGAVDPATASEYGTVKLAGNLTGTADAPVVATTVTVEGEPQTMSLDEYATSMFDSYWGMVQQLSRVAYLDESGKLELALLPGHTHSTSQVTGLDTALAGKASTSHTHTPASLGVVARSGSAVTLWSGTQAQYDALAGATKNAAGFIAVITD